MEKFKKNLIFAFLAQGASMILSILTSLILPKILGVESFAYWQLFLFYSGYVGFFHFGLSDGIYLKYGGTPIEKMDKSLLGSQYRLMLLWQTVISAIALVAIPYFIHDPNRLFVWLLTAIYLIVANATWCLGYIFQSANETRIYSTATIISKLLFAFAIVICVITKQYNFRVYTSLYVAAQGVALIYSLFYGWEFVKAKWISIRTTWSEAFSNMKIGINLTFSNIASSLILGFGKGFVDRHWNLSAFGMFSLAISLVNFILQFITQISMVMFPALRQISDERRTYIYQILTGSLGILLCGVFIFYVPIRMILEVWIPDYEESLKYLSIILPICVFDGKMQMLYTTYMKVLRKERVLLYINIMSCVLSLGLCLLFTRINDVVIMAVFAMVLAIATRSIMSSVYLSRYMELSIESNVIYEIFLTVIFTWTNLNMNPVGAFMTYVIAYATILIIKRKTMRQLFAVIRKKNGWI